MGALADYDKSELIEGTVYDMSPASLKHIAIQRNLSIIIGSFLRGKQCRLFTEAEAVFDEDNYFIPDLMVVCDKSKITPCRIVGAPDFIVEVLSPRTKKRDITVKKATYEKYGVKEYWIIDPKAESIDVYILRDGKFDLDATYHNFTEEEWNDLREEDRRELRLSLKISLYDNLEIALKDVFEE